MGGDPPLSPVSGTGQAPGISLGFRSYWAEGNPATPPPRAYPARDAPLARAPFAVRKGRGLHLTPLSLP